MKQVLLFFFIFSWTFSFGQSITVSKEKLTENISYKSSNVIKYDSVKNTTRLQLFLKYELTVADKWFDYDLPDSLYEMVVGHCPIFVNPNNVILEPKIFIINDADKPLYGIYNMKDYNKLLLRRLKNEKGVLVNTIYNKEKNYHLHTIKKVSKHNKNELITTYQLFGEKGEKVYHFAIYNADDNNNEQIFKFLVDAYTNN